MVDEFGTLDITVRGEPRGWEEIYGSEFAKGNGVWDYAGAIFESRCQI